MNKKKILALMAALAMTVTMSSCGNTADQTTDSAGNSITEENSNKKEKTKSTAKLSDNLLDCSVMFGDEVITLPCELKYFIDNGWTCDNSSYLTKNGYLIRVGVRYHDLFEDEDKIMSAPRAYNLLEDEVAANNGYDRATVEAYPVVFLECNLELNREGTVTLPKGIVLGESTVEDLQNAYGEATNTETSWEQKTYEAFKTKYLYGESPKVVSFDVQFKEGPCASWVDDYLNKTNMLTINLTGEHDPRFD